MTGAASEAGLWTGAVIASTASHLGLAAALLAYEPSLGRPPPDLREEMTVPIVLGPGIELGSNVVLPTAASPDLELGEVASPVPLEEEQPAAAVEPPLLGPEDATEAPDDLPPAAADDETAEVSPADAGAADQGAADPAEATTASAVPLADPAPAPVDPAAPGESLASPAPAENAPAETPIEAAPVAPDPVPAEPAPLPEETSQAVAQPQDADPQSGGAAPDEPAAPAEVVEAPTTQPENTEPAVASGPQDATPDDTDSDTVAVLVPPDEPPSLGQDPAPDPASRANDNDPAGGGLDGTSPAPPAGTATGPGDGGEGPGPGPGPSAQDAALEALAGRIRDTRPAACVVALPRRAAGDGIGLALLGRQDAEMEDFAREVLTGDFAGLPVSSDLVDERQCAALAFVGAVGDYPLSDLGLGLDAPVVEGEGVLGGVVSGVGGRALTVLLVDDNGVVQDLGPFLRFAGDFARFDVPVRRSDDGARETRQIVLAIATDAPPQGLLANVGLRAEEVFAGIAAGLPPDAAVALATVDIR